MRDSRPERLPVGRFFGINERSSRGSGFVLSETRYAPGTRAPQHVHELAYFCLLLDGGYWEQYGHRCVTYEPLSVVFHPAEETHYGDVSPVGGRCFHVEIEPGWMERARELGHLPAEALDRHSGDLVWLARRLYREFAFNEIGSSLVIEGLVLEMLGAVLRRQERTGQRPPAWLDPVVERLREEFTRRLTIAELAEGVGVSPVRLSRAFRKFHHQSPGDYVRRLRVEYACKRLVEPGWSLAEVALECGFVDQSHFQRVFKRLTGSTPGEFRGARIASAGRARK